MRNTKVNIIAAATAAFNEQGYAVLSIDKLAVASNVSKMTFYKYFSDKEALILEVLILRKSCFIDDLNRITRGEPQALVKLRSIFDYYSSWISGPNFNGCMFARAVGELGATNPLIIQINDELKTEITRIIEGILNEILKPASAKRCALIMMMLIDGAIVASMSHSIRSTDEPINLAWIASNYLINNE